MTQPTWQKYFEHFIGAGLQNLAANQTSGGELIERLHAIAADYKRVLINNSILSWPFSLPQEGMLENEFAFAAGKRRSAGYACWRGVNRSGARLDFDDLIERFAVKTCKEN
jgi:hypothetical protein